jgi:hypothetical protein
MCEVYIAQTSKEVCIMYSKEFMKFLYEYQKDDFKPSKPESYEIRFKTPRSGKLAEILETVNRDK